VIDYKDIDKKPDNKTYPFKSISSVLILFALFIFLFLAIYFYTLYTREYYVLKYVAISGNHVLSADTIKSLTLTNKASCINNHDEEDIYSSLIINPWVKMAYVAKIYPDTIYIKILERKPYGIVQSNEKIFIMDKSGNVIDTYKKGLNLDMSKLPLIITEKQNDVNKPFLIKAILEAYRKLDKLGKINYIEIISDSHQLVHFANAFDVEIDSLNCPSKAFEHLRKEWRNLLRKRKRLKSVSICFSDKFVLSWKKERKR